MKSQKDLSRKIGLRIKDLRIKRKFTQEKLSDLAGVDHKHIQLLEGNNPSNAKIGTIETISNALGLSLSEFFSDPIFNLKSDTSNTKKNIVLKLRSNPQNQFLNRTKIIEDNLSYAVYEILALSRGHILIVPKRGMTNYFEALPEEKQSFLSMIEKAKIFLDREYKPDGFNIGFNIGEVAGQIGQFVIHVIPRYKGDNIGIRRI